MSNPSAPPPNKHQRTSIIGWTQKRSVSPAGAEMTASPSGTAESPENVKRVRRPAYSSMTDVGVPVASTSTAANAPASAGAGAYRSARHSYANAAGSSSTPSPSGPPPPAAYSQQSFPPAVSAGQQAITAVARFTQSMPNGVSRHNTQKLVSKVTHTIMTNPDLARQSQLIMRIFEEARGKIDIADAPAPASLSKAKLARRTARQNAFKANLRNAMMAKGPLPDPDFDTASVEEAEYNFEVPEYMVQMDNDCLANASSMDGQPEVQWYMRPFLVDFLIEVHAQFRLRPEVLYLTMNIVDRYVSKRVVYKKHYQLVGCTALWIAAKFEDAKDKVPLVKELAEMCCKAYDETAFIQMEGHVLSTVDWNLGTPTAEAWLRIYCAGGREDLRTASIARFVMELSIFYREHVGIPAYDIAAGALMLARYICGKHKRADLAHDRPKMFGPESADRAVRVAYLLDAKLVEFSESVSDVLQRKYMPSYYSNASAYVCEWYSNPRHRFESVNHENPFSRWQSADAITNPWHTMSWVSSSPSASFSSTASSENGDDGPLTPNTPSPLHHTADPFHLAQHQHQQQQRAAKENVAPTPTKTKPGQVVPTSMTALPPKTAGLPQGPGHVQDVNMLYPTRPALNTIDQMRHQDQQQAQALRRLSN